ncbi:MULTISPECIES: NAD(P)H-binding protein [unclassified Campylobacter]|uniref:NAD(P)H-binding protein n=1 Tax=unclassified Campylobacter TaxID=2593542 RepID=UPI001237E61F|nr:MULTISPECIES: NAD(P)H-binding protein [unclassified Campylobacter]KAA6225137.1 NAD(P)-dependent oxidoreductase [Campylobacter sp. LR196d]KAA6226151.1 NAD(P)-dependent oxidoreductase [Campylobacter sp. LR185c]KAA6228099.1 NAD(P)-dependent oxidoreductase [Campylobacter sp. LR286c]KAA6231351.1 NAD(P)-dependent oxidoreductase [Campylobacter sp. LR264d]KAA6231563.1 NAD(P)-dependent oxidoreductase [Campylobacter sp. LR291e]
MKVFKILILSLFCVLNLSFGKDSSQNLKIAVLAANGKTGSLIVKEALDKKVQVTAFVRNSTQRLPQNASIIKKDIFNLTSDDLKDYNVIIDAFGEWKDLSLHKKHMQHLINILKDNNAKFIAIGGAGSLFVDKEHQIRLMDSPNFPDSYKGVAKATYEAFEVLKTSNLNYIYVSPPATYIADDKKSGYILGSDELFTNSNNESSGSYTDLADAVIDLALDKNAKTKTHVSVVSK